MFAAIINDCRDENARGRQVARVSELLQCGVAFAGVEGDLAASGNLIDTLDATGGREGVVLVNVAPRNGSGKQWANGTPFAFFRFEKTLVIASFSGLTLSLVKKLGVVGRLNLVDLTETALLWVRASRISAEHGDVLLTQYIEQAININNLHIDVQNHRQLAQQSVALVDLMFQVIGQFI